MDRIYKDYLFSKHILVKEGTEKADTKNVAVTLFELASKYDILIRFGEDLADETVLGYVKQQIGGEYVPDAFYRSFPMSVKMLTKDELLVDQLIHYIVTYGFGNFNEAGHSLLETEVERTALKETHEPKVFKIYSEECALKVVGEYIKDMLKGTRPLNVSQNELVAHFYKQFRSTKTYWVKEIFQEIGSKDLAVRLLVEFRIYINFA